MLPVPTTEPNIERRTPMEEVNWFCTKKEEKDSISNIYRGEILSNQIAA